MVKHKTTWFGKLPWFPQSRNRLHLADLKIKGPHARTSITVVCQLATWAGCDVPSLTQHLFSYPRNSSLYNPHLIAPLLIPHSLPCLSFYLLQVHTELKALSLYIYMLHFLVFKLK